MVPVLEPSNQQEAYDMARYGFDLSEKHRIPVMIRLVTRLSHSRGVVATVAEPDGENGMSYPQNPRQWVLMPGNSKVRYPQLIEDYAALAGESCRSPFNTLTWASDRSLGIITTGIAYNYLTELFPGGVPFPVLKISQYPLPVDMIRDLAAETDALLILEEGQPYVERQLRGLLDRGGKVYGKLDGKLNRTGELTPDRVREALVKVCPSLAGDLTVESPAVSQVTVPRPPALCQGCGHRDVYSALNEVLRGYENPKVFGDIGCYTLGMAVAVQCS